MRASLLSAGLAASLLAFPSSLYAQHYVALDSYSAADGKTFTPQTAIELSPWGSVRLGRNLSIDDVTRLTALERDRAGEGFLLSFDRTIDANEVIFRNSVAVELGGAFAAGLRLSDFGLNERANIVGLSKHGDQTFLIADTEVKVSGNSHRAGDVLVAENGQLTVALEINDFGIPENVRGSSLAKSADGFLMSFDSAFQLGGEVVLPTQVLALKVTDTSASKLATFSAIADMCEYCRIVGLSYDQSKTDIVFSDAFTEYSP